MSASSNSGGLSKVSALDYAGSAAAIILTGIRRSRARWPAASKPGSQALSNFAIPRHGSGIRPDDRAPTMIHKYHIKLFWSEPDGAWIVNVPDLQSCSAFGDTPAEALAEIEQAIEAWLAVARDDGLPIPEPRYRAPAGGRVRARHRHRWSRSKCLRRVDSGPSPAGAPMPGLRRNRSSD
jgi:predicted RNase H-like HicB family nuclease